MSEHDPAAPPMNPEQLARLTHDHGLDGRVRFELGEGGLARAVVDTELASGECYLHGAHVSAWAPAGHEAVLFTSSRAAYRSGKAIRGGIPLCFPWFGRNASAPAAPSHGRVRTRAWPLASTRLTASGEVELEFAIACEPFDVRYRVRFGASLHLSLSVSLAADVSPASYEAALHTYLQVGDVRRVTVSGLEAARYRDKVAGGRETEASGTAIRFVGETDRVYLDTTDTVRVEQPTLSRRVSVSKTGSHNTVVWNPWIDKAAALGDLGDEEWTRFCCVETANVGAQAITLEPGTQHTMSATIDVEPRGRS